MSLAERLFCAPVAGIVPVSTGEANALLTRWGHYLGPCERPFGQEGWVLDVDGTPVAVAVSASTVSATTAGGYKRDEIVELARLCSDPQQRWATRPMLRLWREVAARRWSYWPVRAAVAYSASRRHEGDIYRFDGWRLVNESKGENRGGGTWTKLRAADDPATGPKRLWVYEFRAGRDSAT